MSRNTGFLAATALSMVLALPLAAQESAQTVLARVGETEITLGHAIALREQLPPQFRTVDNETLFPAIVEQLIEQELLAQHIAGSLTLRDRITLENEVRNFTANAALFDATNAAISDATLAEAYSAFTEEFGQGDPVTEYNAAHILVQTEDEITAVIAELDSGRDFAEVAREFSMDGSAADGGNLGWFGEGVMIEPFENAVMALEPGEVSGPVETRFGWHVVRLNETRIASVPPLEAVRDELASQIQRETSRALLEELRAAASIENRSEGVDPDVLGRTELLDE